MGDPDEPTGEAHPDLENVGADAAKVDRDAEARERAEAEARAKAAVERARAEAARKRAEAEKNKAAKSTTMVSAEAPEVPASPAPAADEIKAEPAKATGAEVIAALGVDPETLAASPKSTLVSGAPAKLGKDAPATRPVTEAGVPTDAAATKARPTAEGGARLAPSVPEPSPRVDETAERQRALAAEQARAQTKALQSQPSVEIQQTAPMPRFPAPPRRAAAPDALALKTRLAQKFTTLADEVNASFVDFHVGAGNWGLELTAPEGMSTAGGKQATQALKMRPKRQGYPPLVAGFVDPVNNSAELRDYPHICLVHELRAHEPLEITEGEWEQLLRKTETVLKAANIRAVRTPPDPELLAEKSPTGVMKYGYAPFVLAAAVVGAAIVLWRVLVAFGGPG